MRGLNATRVTASHDTILVLWKKEGDRKTCKFRPENVRKRLPPACFTGLSRASESLTQGGTQARSSFKRFERDFKRGQPAENLKPLALMCHLVACYSDAGDTVGDTCGMFTGVSGQACMRMGRRFLGVEIDKKLFRAACARIEGERE